MNSSPLFADRIINVAVTGSLVRLELGSLAPPQTKEQKPELQACQTLVMPLDGLLASLGMLDALVKQLVADGQLKPKSPAETV